MKSQPQDNEPKYTQVSRSRKFGLTTQMVNEWNKQGSEGKSIRYEAKDWLAIDRKQFEALLNQSRNELLDELEKEIIKLDRPKGYGTVAGNVYRHYDIIELLASKHTKPLKEDI